MDLVYDGLRLPSSPLSFDAQPAPTADELEQQQLRQQQQQQPDDNDELSTSQLPVTELPAGRLKG